MNSEFADFFDHPRFASSADALEWIALGERGLYVGRGLMELEPGTILWKQAPFEVRTDEHGEQTVHCCPVEVEP